MSITNVNKNTLESDIAAYIEKRTQEKVTLEKIARMSIMPLIFFKSV